MFFDSYLRVSMYGQLAAMILFSIFGLVLLVLSGLAMAGVLPWLQMEVAYLGQTVPWAGQAFQIGLTVMVLLLAVYVPTNRRIMMLEASQRDFALSMDDISRAYAAVHLADKRDAFGMEREFDAVRERFEYLRKHPDLPEIDGELLTIAAQMSEQSRHLAKTFSEEKMLRARESLTQRRADAEELETRIQAANAASVELRRGLEDVEFAENSAAAQLMRLREDLAEIEARIAGEDARKGRHLRPVSDVS
ncbi:MAG: DNA repair protein [Pseudomonadota bacterium]